MSVPPAFDLQGLLAEDQWIRRLARKLAGDAHAAEDLVQDTWAAALDARESARPRALRPWLRGILRNLWSDAKSMHAARARREQRVARAEALEPTSELVAELELRKHLAEALLALEEPYRSALYLRFFRDHSLAAIGKRQGIAPSSAHERIQHGLVRLRARLDREHGGRRGAWAVGLLALAKPAGVTTAAAEMIAMTGGLKLTASALVIGGGVAWFWFHGGGDAAPIGSRTPAPDEIAEVHALDGAPGLSISLPARAPVVSEEGQAPRPAAESEVLAALVHGRVVDPEGAPLGSVRVGWVGAGAHASVARSESDGAFALPDSPAGTIRCLEPDLVTLVPGERAGSFRSESLLVVAAPRAAFGGVVLDPHGQPVAGARLRFQPRQLLLRELGLTPSPLEHPEWEATSATDGTFRLEGVAGGPRVLLQVEALGFWVQNVDLPPVSALDLVVRLVPSEHERRIHGYVLDPAGLAAAGARVSAGDAIVECDALGTFELVLGGRHGTFGPIVPSEPAPVESPAHLVALLPGYLPARETLADLELDQAIVLRLGARPATIAGHVREEDGHAAAGIVLWARDSTPFGRQMQSGGEGATMVWEKTVEEELAGVHHAPKSESDAEGAFEIQGLLERPYAVMAYDPARAELFGPWTLDAGSKHVELVLARTGRSGPVAGRVVSVSGAPIAGVGVSPWRAVPDADYRGQVPRPTTNRVVTDEEGRFRFEELVLDGLELDLEHPSLGWRQVPLDPRADLVHLELVQARLCDVQVRAADPGLADAFALLDASGERIEIQETFGGGWMMTRETQISKGLSPVVRAPETATTLVLLRKEAEVLRRPIELVPGELNVLRP